MMAAMKEHSILSAGEFIHIIGMPYVVTRWSWEEAFWQFLGQTSVISWPILKRS